MDAKRHNNPDKMLSVAQSASGMRRNEAVSDLLDRYRSYLSVLARVYIDRRLQAKIDDSDLVQEAMLQAHRDFDQFRGATEGELVAWLRAILASKGAMQTRHYYGTKQRDPRLEQQIQQDFDDSSMNLAGLFVDDGSSPSERAEKRERAVLLANALDQLPQHYRDVMIMHHLQGLTMPQVATRLNRTVDSVQKIWARALLGLRKKLSELE